MYQTKGQAHVNRDDAPPSTPAPTSSKPSNQSPGWKINVKSLSTVAASIIFAAGVVAGGLSRLSPDVRDAAFSTFRRWPLPLQILAGIVALMVFVAIALWYPIRQAMQTREQQDVITQGMKQATAETRTDDVATIRTIVEDDVPIMRKVLDEILRVLASVAIVPVLPPLASVVESIPVLPQVSAAAAVQEAAKPKDDVQFTPPEIFIGCEKELSWLEERLVSHRQDRDTTVIVGISGIGKTALASLAIDRIKGHHFTDGIARVNCAGMIAVEIVRYSLERVDPGRRLPAALDLDILHQMSEKLLAGKDVLIVLDGVEPDVPLGDVVRALHTEQRSVHILITTTQAPSVDVVPGDSHLYLRALGTMTRDDGTKIDEPLELFARYAGKPSSTEFGEHLGAAIEIVESLERHTYAL